MMITEVLSRQRKTEAMCTRRFLLFFVIASTTLLLSIAECCELETVNNCVLQLETSLQNWTQSEQCIQFVQSEGNFSRCKRVLESCTDEDSLLQRLGHVNVKLASSCPKVCPSHKEIKQQCSIDATEIMDRNYTEFCSKYTAAINCARNYEETCAIASEFHQKAVITSKLSHMYRNLCYKGCSTLALTKEAMDSCRWFVKKKNCSIVEFDECVQQLNTTLCPEYKKLYGFWFHPKCLLHINPEVKTTSSSNDISIYNTLINMQTSITSTWINMQTSITSEQSHLHSTVENDSQKEGHVAAGSCQGAPCSFPRVLLITLIITTVFWPDLVVI